MMQCQICGDVNGPFEIIERKKEWTDIAGVKMHVNEVLLACEDCARAERIKNGTANLRDKRHVNRVSRSNRRSKR